jgi:hypothetical protein
VRVIPEGRAGRWRRSATRSASAGLFIRSLARRRDPQLPPPARRVQADVSIAAKICSANDNDQQSWLTHALQRSRRLAFAPALSTLGRSGSCVGVTRIGVEQSRLPGPALLIARVSRRRRARASSPARIGGRVAHAHQQSHALASQLGVRNRPRRRRSSHIPNLLRTRRASRKWGNRGSRDLPSCCRARVVGDARVAGFVPQAATRAVS